MLEKCLVNECSNTTNKFLEAVFKNPNRIYSGFQNSTKQLFTGVWEGCFWCFCFFPLFFQEARCGVCPGRSPAPVLKQSSCLSLPNDYTAGAYHPDQPLYPFRTTCVLVFLGQISCLSWASFLLGQVQCVRGKWKHTRASLGNGSLYNMAWLLSDPQCGSKVGYMCFRESQ